MQEAAPHPFSAWDSFYVIVGSSAGALTGLQFVVITLVKDAWREPSTGEIGAFATPTIFHFCAVLLVSATLSAPWPGLLGPELVMGACGLAGIAYAAYVAWRGTHRTHYQMMLEDWIWHVTLPIIAYFVMAAGALALGGRFTEALFAIAGSALLLLYIGIHNAWDTTTYVASGEAAAEEGERKERGAPAGAGSERATPPKGEAAVSSGGERR